MRDLLSARALGRDVIEELLGSARAYRAGGGRRHPDALVLLAFYEDSLRTRIGFDAAAARLGARTTTILAERRSAAMWAPERIEDAVRSVGPWCDVVCLRAGAQAMATRAADLLDAPVVNCGNGTDEHPTQALVDLFAIEDQLGRVDGLTLALVGDLDAMRSAHSLALALGAYERVKVRCVCPPGLELPSAYADGLDALEATDAMDVDDVDVLYVAGLPAETRIGVLSAERQADYRVTPEVVARMPEHARVLCPLPRVDEIDPRVDDLDAAGYFAQSANALWVRMAILDAVLG